MRTRTVPPIAHGKMNKEKEDHNKTIKDYIDEIVNPIFAEKLGVPQEELSNSITTTKKKFIYFFRPNNWRLQIEVKEKTNSTINYIRKTNPTININPHTKLISLKRDNIIIQYGKKTLTTIYSNPIKKGVKQGWRIEEDNINAVTNRITEIKEFIEKTLNDTLNEFSHKFKVFLPFIKPIWGRYEDFIKGESYIDKIPPSCQFIDTIGKKVYAEGFEFTGGKGEEPTIHLKNYLKNQSIKDHSPEIAESINEIGLKFDKFTNEFIPTQKELIKTTKLEITNKKLHQKVLNSMDKTLKDIRDSLPKRGLLKWL